jgi:hypothetical protein
MGDSAQIPAPAFSLSAAAIAPEQFAGEPQEEMRILKQQALLSQQVAYHGAPVQIENLLTDVFPTIW